MNYIYIVYTSVDYRNPLGSPDACIARAFVEDGNSDGFAVCSEHISSNFGWAWQDIRRNGHRECYEKLFPNGYKIVDVNAWPMRDEHDSVIDSLRRKHDELKEGGDHA